MKLDKDNSGTLSRAEFLSLPTIASNPLATRLLALFDSDASDSIDFAEFVNTLSIFSSKGGKEEKMRFLFSVYDLDRDGYVSNGELWLVLKCMVGGNLKDGQLQQVCAGKRSVRGFTGDLNSNTVYTCRNVHNLLWD
ncbi:Calcineurin subunit B [Elasticomyces elasticus]|nr:Calcineurin subunit B [Elasticomyces elasticus]